LDNRRTIIVTGASSGIGAHSARRLKGEGWRVLATARKPEDIAALEADGVEAFHLDYREPESIRKLAEDVLSHTGGRLDALFNNGAYGLPGAVEDLPLPALREQFEANFFGWHDLTSRIVPTMRRQGFGRIVHCSSILGIVPLKFRGAYAASKFALEGLMMCQRMELAPAGIQVSMIEPGAIETRFRANALAAFLKTIDVENSHHREAYQAQLARLTADASQRRGIAGPEAVYVALRHALLSAKPRPHYVVTRTARLGALMKRVLPAGLFYRIVDART
jgi:NAD(P)-dependent dehydrogenase (short-subunit alcohol dehydrogenase family)